MKPHLFAILVLYFLSVERLTAEMPVRLHPANGHYFEYKSKPTVLVTSAEHYGSVLNLKFDYATYLDELQANRFNLTRTFTGTYREEGTSGHGPSPLSPGRGPDHFIAPWAWSDVAGGFEGKKFDLDRWNPEYFARLKRFCKLASQRGVVVELVLFCRMYDDQRWRSSPLHPDNNLQGESWRGLDSESFTTMENRALLERQKAVARKIVRELRDEPNVYFEIVNEPGQGMVGSDRAKRIHAWHEAIIDEIVAEESSLSSRRRHLIAYNTDYTPGQGIGPIPKPEAMSIINFHYLMRLLEVLLEYQQGKALGFDETRWIAHNRYPGYRNTMTNDAGRFEAWEFLIGGGSVYSNLNHAYQVENPRGRSPQSEEFKQYLRILMEFIHSFDLVRMRQDRNVLQSGLVQSESTWRAISEPGRQYAIYIHHGAYTEGKRSYKVGQNAAGSRVDLTIDLPRGTYQVEWIQPTTLTLLGSQRVENHLGQTLKLATSPAYGSDIALKILRGR
jgi:hypothetical protein